MPKRSAGVLLFRKSGDGLEALLVHPGDPYWAKRDTGVWSIPKGEYDEREDAETAARRELREETGIAVSGPLLALGTFRQPSGKLVTAFAARGAFDPADLKSDTCRLEWPPKSGRLIEIPEVDRAAWFRLEEALTKITKGQAPIIAALERKLAASAAEEP
jgi:predicted NUDIX family NTP pyrophosphohydrolase